MTKSEVAKLLALAASYDQRTTGEADVEAWSLVIGDLDFQKSMDAVVRHYGTAEKRIMPFNIRNRVVGTPIPPRWRDGRWVDE